MQSAWVRLHPSAVHNYQYDGIAALQMRPRSQLEAQHPKSLAKIQLCPLLYQNSETLTHVAWRWAGMISS